MRSLGINTNRRMLRTHNSILMHRGIQDVYRFVAVDFFDNYRKWSPEVRELKKLTSGQMRVGVTGRQVRYDGGYRSEALFEVTRFVPLLELRFISLSKPKFEVAYLFEQVASNTRLTFDFQLELPFFMQPLHGRIGDSVGRGGRRVVCNLKELLETNAVARASEINGNEAQAGPATDGPVSG